MADKSSKNQAFSGEMEKIDLQHVLQQFKTLREDMDQMSTMFKVDIEEGSMRSLQPVVASGSAHGETNEVALHSYVQDLTNKCENLRDVFEQVANHNTKLTEELDSLKAAQSNSETGWVRLAHEISDEQGVWRNESEKHKREIRKLEDEKEDETERIRQLEGEKNQLETELRRMNQLETELSRMKSRNFCQILIDAVTSCCGRR